MPRPPASNDGATTGAGIKSRAGSGWEPQAVSPMLLPALDRRTPLVADKKYGKWADPPKREWSRPLADLLGEVARAQALTTPDWSYPSLQSALNERSVTLPEGWTIERAVELVADGIIRNYITYARSTAGDAERYFDHKEFGVMAHRLVPVNEGVRLEPLRNDPWKLVIARTLVEVAEHGRAPNGTWPEQIILEGLEKANVALPVTTAEDGVEVPISMGSAIESVLDLMRELHPEFVEANVDGPMNRIAADPTRGHEPLEIDEVHLSMPGAYLHRRNMDQTLHHYVDLYLDLATARARLERDAQAAEHLVQAVGKEIDVLAAGLVLATAARPDEFAWARWTERAGRGIDGLPAADLACIVEASPHEALLPIRAAEAALRASIRRHRMTAGVCRGAAILAERFEAPTDEGAVGVAQHLRRLADLVDEVEDSRPVSSAATNPLLIEAATQANVVPPESSQFTRYCTDIAMTFMAAIGYEPRR